MRRLLPVLLTLLLIAGCTAVGAQGYSGDPAKLASDLWALERKVELLEERIESFEDPGVCERVPQKGSSVQPVGKASNAQIYNYDPRHVEGVMIGYNQYSIDCPNWPRVAIQDRTYEAIMGYCANAKDLSPSAYVTWLESFDDYCDASGHQRKIFLMDDDGWAEYDAERHPGRPS